MEEIKQDEITLTPTEGSPAVAVQNAVNYLDSAAMNKLYKTATVFSQSDLVPDTYKGKPANVLLAMDIASRMGAGIMLVMQNLYIVKGKPAWSGQFCIAAINGCGKFSPLKFIEVEEGGGGCYCTAVRLYDNEVCNSPFITLKMAKEEGWLDKAGSKWKTMPEQMARYRAATFFARTFCPEILMGIHTADEIKDVSGDTEQEKQTVTISL